MNILARLARLYLYLIVIWLSFATFCGGGVYWMTHYPDQWATVQDKLERITHSGKHAAGYVEPPPEKTHAELEAEEDARRQAFRESQVQADANIAAIRARKAQESAELEHQ